MIYYVQDISKESFKGTTFFLLATWSKMWEERNKLRIEPLNKREPETGGLENFQALQRAKDANIKILQVDQS